MCKLHIQNCCLEEITTLGERGKTCYSSLSIGEEKDMSIWFCNYYIFLVSQTHTRNMMVFSFFFGRISCFIFARVRRLCSFMKTFSFGSYYTSIPLCSMFISTFFCGQNIAYHGQENKWTGMFCQILQLQ